MSCYTLLNFVSWFIFFGLSFLVERLGLGEQGKAFVFIKIIIPAIGISLLILIYLFGRVVLDKSFGDLFTRIQNYTISLVLVSMSTLLVTKLFDVNFAVAFQIMTFGQCLAEVEVKEYNN